MEVTYYIREEKMATVKDVLERAEEYAASGQDEKARRFYQAVIDRMPGTKEALDAQKRLDVMAKSAAVTFDLEDLDGAPPQTQAPQPRASAGAQPAGKVKTCRACGQAIPKSAKVCPYCGAKQKGKTLWIVLGAVALFLMIVVVAAGGGSDSSSKKSSAKSGASKSTASESNQTQSASKAQEKPVATMDKYNKIQNNMSYAQVKAIMGFDGTEQASANASAVGVTVNDKIYNWEGEYPGASMSVTFQNDKVVSKAQAGLK